MRQWAPVLPFHAWSSLDKKGDCNRFGNGDELGKVLSSSKNQWMVSRKLLPHDGVLICQFDASSLDSLFFCLWVGVLSLWSPPIFYVLNWAAPSFIISRCWVLVFYGMQFPFPSWAIAFFTGAQHNLWALQLHGWIPQNVGIRIDREWFQNRFFLLKNLFYFTIPWMKMKIGKNNRF